MDYSLTDDEIDKIVDDCISLYNDNQVDFSKYKKEIFTQNGNKRIIYHYPSDSVENYLSHYLKNQLDKSFKIKYSKRNEIIHLLFNMMQALNHMKDFVIVRADFKSFFDSIMPKFVYENYIALSQIHRDDKELLEAYSSSLKYCRAGMCLSNGMAEIACRDFDNRIKAKLITHGIFFYERFVDDIILIMNRYVTKEEIIEIINDTIRDSFGECPVKLNLSEGKFSYVSRRDLESFPTKKVSFSFLGYEFYIQPHTVKNSIKLKLSYGITATKRKRYANIIEHAFIQYKKDENVELLRQRVKVYSSRVIIAQPVLDNSMKWLTKGVVANYNELRYYTENLDKDTEDFFRCLYHQILKKHNIKRPYFLEKEQQVHSRKTIESVYSIYSNLKRNRTLLFEETIGIPKQVILNWIKKIDTSYISKNKGYYAIVMDYLEIIKNK